MTAQTPRAMVRGIRHLGGNQHYRRHPCQFLTLFVRIRRLLFACQFVFQHGDDAREFAGVLVVDVSENLMGFQDMPGPLDLAQGARWLRRLQIARGWLPPCRARSLRAGRFPSGNPSPRSSSERRLRSPGSAIWRTPPSSAESRAAIPARVPMNVESMPVQAAKIHDQAVFRPPRSARRQTLSRRGCSGKSLFLHTGSN